MKSSIFRNITPCSLFKINWASEEHVVSVLLASCRFLPRIILRPWRWQVSQKCRLIFNRLYGVISQKTEIFTRIRRGGTFLHWDPRICRRRMVLGSILEKSHSFSQLKPRGIKSYTFYVRSHCSSVNEEQLLSGKTAWKAKLERGRYVIWKNMPPW
jgi:hypothetical protein